MRASTKVRIDRLVGRLPLKHELPRGVRVNAVYRSLVANVVFLDDGRVFTLDRSKVDVLRFVWQQHRPRYAARS